jgi:hypothetical protein
VISWPNTNTGAILDSALAAGRYTHVIYENRNWKDYPGGAATLNAIGEASGAGTLEKIASFEDTLYTSRFRRTYRTTRVYVLRRVNERIF